MASRKGRKRSQVNAAKRPPAPPPKRSTGIGPSWLRGPRSTWSRIGMAALLPVLALAIALGVGLSRGGGHGGSGGRGGTGAVTIWGANGAGLAARLQANNLPLLSSEGTVLHIHQHLDVYVNGKHVRVPAEIGVGPDFISPVHTHDVTGAIHVESPVLKTFTLGQFFAVWGVRLSPTCVGSYCEKGAAKLRVYVDGNPFKGDPRSIKLSEHEEIAVTYGTQAQLPKPVPSTYNFRALGL